MLKNLPHQCSTGADRCFAVGSLCALRGPLVVDLLFLFGRLNRMVLERCLPAADSELCAAVLSACAHRPETLGYRHVVE